MVSWVIIGMLILVAAIIWIKFEHKTKRIKMIVVLLLIVFLYFSVSSVVHKNNISLGSPSGWYSAGSLYLSWLGDIGTGIWDAGGQLRGIAGNVIKTTPNSSASDWKINIRR